MLAAVEFAIWKFAVGWVSGLFALECLVDEDHIRLYFL